MKRKITDLLLFLAALAGCLGLTLVVSNGNYLSSSMLYNYAFLALIAVLYLIAMFGGFYRMDHLSSHLKHLSGLIGEMNHENVPAGKSRIQMLMGYEPIDQKLNTFSYDLHHTQSGICDIEDYINEDEIDDIVGKRMLDMMPEVLTSLGILGTFMGLVWGLRAFEPSNYEAMTASVTSLVSGIKVAFLTSIYGLVMSIVFSFSMRKGYTELSRQLQIFLERFHMYIVPSAETATSNRFVSNQKEQNAILKELTSEFSDQVAQGFAGSIAPTLDRINSSLGGMMETISHSQQMFLQEIVDTFVREMKHSFQTEFREFGSAVEQTKESMSQNARYTEKLYQDMCTQMEAVFTKDEAHMHTAVAELAAVQKKYADTASQVSSHYQEMLGEYQKVQSTALKNLQTAEQESSRFWVACNQAMQNYLKEAAEAYQKFEKANESGEKLLTAVTAVYQKNETILEEQKKQTQELIETQTEVKNTLQEIASLFQKIDAVSGQGNKIYLYPEVSSKKQEEDQKLLGRMETMILESEEKQEEMYSEMKKTMKEFSESAAKKPRWFGR